MPRKPQVYQVIASKLAGLELNQPEHVSQCQYAVAAPSRAGAVRALNAVGLNVSDSFMRDYGYPAQDVRPDTQTVADQPGEVFYRELDRNNAWRRVRGA
jgi:hypothetical protein